MNQDSATTSHRRPGRRVLQLLVALAVLGSGVAMAQQAGAGEVVPGARFKSGPSPLPELTPFQAPRAEAKDDEAGADGGEVQGISGTEVLLAGAALAAFLVLRLRRPRG